MRFALGFRKMHRSLVSLVPLVFATLALCAWLHARGVVALVGGELTVPHIRSFEAPVSLAIAPPRDADPILARNPFDSITGPLGLPFPTSAPPENVGTLPCDDVRVVSIVGASDPDESLVLLDVAGEREPILRRRGGEVLAIGPDRILMDRGGKRCVARIFAPAAATSTPAASAPVPGATQGIVRTGPDSFALDRSARDALIEGAADLMRSIAVRPETHGDDVLGLRVAMLKPGTPLENLGIRAGDVLQSVDGIPLGSPDRMLEAYARVRTEERVRLVVLREGRPLQLDYQVH